jgi:hypothetical protein
MSLRDRRLPASALAVAIAVLVGGSVRTRAEALPRVTMIGDSAAASIEYTQTARAILAAGIDLRLEMAPCRRVSQASCPYEGVRPLTVVELVPKLGDALGQTVIVAVGYNDYESAYAGNIQDALDALRRAGVVRVLWLTLHEARPAYASMNDAIRAAAVRHPEMTAVDWQLYSRSHPSWFQADGIHLQKDGAEAMATLVHNALETLGIPLSATPAQQARALSIVTSRLPEAVVGRPYSARLVARGGSTPVRWTRRGLMPRGLALRSDGRITGVPAQAGTFAIVVRATDAQRASLTRAIALRVRRASTAG